MCNWAPPKSRQTSSEAPHVGLGAEARSQPYVGAVAAGAAPHYVNWPVLRLHHHRRARMPGATGPNLQRAHPRLLHTNLSPLPWKQQANKKTKLYICTYNKKCNHLPRIEAWSSSANTKNYVLLSRSFHRDKKSKPSRKNKNYRKAKKPKGESLTKNAKAQLQPELGKNQGTAGLYEINK